jgi:transporter family protein
VIVNKRVLVYLDPLATNMLVRVASLITILLVTTPLTLLHGWGLTYRMTWAAAGYIAVSAVVIWLLAFNFYYYALRSGRVSVVTPITSTDPLFTALFAVVLVGGALGGLTVSGLLIAVAGVILISRAIDEGETATSGPVGEPPPLALPEQSSLAAHVAARPASAMDDGILTTRRPWVRSAPAVIVLSVLTAVGWGLGPVLIQLAERSVGGTSVTMVLQSQGLGLALLAGIVLARRAPLATRRLTPQERRRTIWLVVAAGVLEATFSIVYYLVIEHIGAVLTVLIGATSPIFAIAGGVVLLRERLGRRLALGALVTLLGVFLATVDRIH